MNCISCDRPLAATPMNDITELILRYPCLTGTELDTLVDGLPRLTIVETALIAADPKLAARLDDFHRDHGHRLRKLRSHMPLKLCAAAVSASLLAFAIGWSVRIG